MADKRYIGLGKETGGFGVAAAATRYLEAIESIRPDQGWIIPDPVANRQFRKKNLGPFRSRGNIGEFDVEPENIGEILLGVLGSVSSQQQGGTSAYKHTFSPADTLPSWTLRVGTELDERILAGMLFNSLTLRFAHAANLRAIAEAVGAKVIETSGTLGTPSLSALQAFVYHQTTTLTIESSDKKAEVYDGQTVINNNIPLDRGNLADRFFNVKRYGQRKITGTLSAYFDTDTERDRFLAGTEFELVLEFTGPLITGSYYYKLKITLPACIYLRDTVPHVVSLNESIVLDAPFQAFYDATAEYDIQVELTNEITSY